MKSIIILIILVITSSIAFAQDPVKVAPDKVKILFENDKVRVLDFTVKPGESTGMHSHPEHVMYLLTDARIKSTTPDGKSNETVVKTGEAKWVKAVTHNNENAGTTDLHAVIFELKSEKKSKK
jgi:quercetin dioxygenase-like cupin family protein